MVSDYKNCVLAVYGASTVTGKLMVKGAIGTTEPTWSVNPSERGITDTYDFIEVTDLEDGATIDGDDGIDLAANVVRLVKVNVDSLDWLAVHFTDNAVGVITVKGLFTTNE